MAEALIRGLVQDGVVTPERIVASGPRGDRLAELAEAYRVETTTDNAALARQAEILVLAVKPQILERVLREVASAIPPGTLVVSVAAGIDTATIESHLPSGARVVRAMPNMPALVRAGATAIARGRHATDADLVEAKTIFDAVGLTIVLDESQLDAVTGLSGSGPAYIFLILEALADAGVKVGLSRRNAQRLAAQTVMGSAKLLLDTDEHPGKLKDMVTSPGGTAIAGLHTLEEGGLRTTLINAVETATKRARELGRGGKG
ncbi:MAG: pyrroline-5-carboxylate reductase [Myxococcales bacterium]|nr:pyrroline-5-carboxylate reductase [Myxococcales bacterium]